MQTTAIATYFTSDSGATDTTNTTTNIHQTATWYTKIPYSTYNQKGKTEPTQDDRLRVQTCHDAGLDYKHIMGKTGKQTHYNAILDYN
jgi:hypothetical protein